MIRQMKHRSIFRVHENGIARSASERINVGVDQTVKLFPAPGADLTRSNVCDGIGALAKVDGATQTPADCLTYFES